MIFIYLLVLLSACPNHPWFGEQVGGVTLVKYLGLMCLIYAVGYAIHRRGQVALFDTWPKRCFAILAPCAIGSYLLEGTSVASNVSPLMLYLSFCLLFVVLQCVVDSPRRFEWSLLSLIGALSLASLYSLREYQMAGFSAYRPGYVVGDANYFSAATLLTMPLAFHWSSTNPIKVQRWFCISALGLIFIAFVVSASRGAFAGLCVMLLVMLSRSKQKQKLVLLVVLAVPLLIYAPISPTRRLMNPGVGDTQSEQIHHALWKFGVDMAFEHPLTGIGLGRFKSMTEQYHVVDVGGFMGHNAYIEMAAELGLPGVIAFVGIIITSLTLLQKNRQHARRLKDEYMFAVSTGLQEGLIGFSVAAFFFSAEYEKPFWVVVFLAAKLPEIAHKRYAIRRDMLRLRAKRVFAEPSSQEIA